MKISPFVKVYQNVGNNTQPVVYTSNGSVTQDVLILFKEQLQANLDELNNAFDIPIPPEFIRLISLIISHSLRLTVKHMRWIYAYTGQIYTMYDSVVQLEPVIRELCEQISYFVINFKCNSYFVKSVIAELNQICIEMTYPHDISRFIAFNNGILDLRTMNLLPFQPGLFITSMVKVNWNPCASYCPNFDKIISIYTNSDPVLTQRLLEALGVILTNDTIKSILCFVGITDSGKSFIVNHIIDMLNENSVASMSPEDLGRQFALAKVFDKSVCVCHDMPAEPLDAQATSVMKKISGGDTIGAEFKYQNGNVNFVSKAHLLLCSNFNIASATNDIAFNKRKVIIPFTHRIVDENIQAEDLKEILYPEHEAIVQKLILAYLNLKNNNYIFSGTGTWIDSYIPPDSFEIDKERSIMMFISNCCDITNNFSDFVFVSDLHSYYNQFAVINNCATYQDQAIFSRDFTKQCPCQKAKRRKNPGENPTSCLTGIRLK